MSLSWLLHNSLGLVLSTEDSQITIKKGTKWGHVINVINAKNGDWEKDSSGRGHDDDWATLYGTSLLYNYLHNYCWKEDIVILLLLISSLKGLLT